MPAFLDLNHGNFMPSHARSCRAFRDRRKVATGFRKRCRANRMSEPAPGPADQGVADLPALSPYPGVPLVGALTAADHDRAAAPQPNWSGLFEAQNARNP